MVVETTWSLKIIVVSRSPFTKAVAVVLALKVAVMILLEQLLMIYVANRILKHFRLPVSSRQPECGSLGSSEEGKLTVHNRDSREIRKGWLEISTDKTGYLLK